MRKTLLIIDDDAFFSDVLKDHFSHAMDVLVTATGHEGLVRCAERPIDVVLLDQNLPDGDGHTFCGSILKHNDTTKIIFVTAFPSFKHAVTAMKAGAFDYLTKPFELEALDFTVQHALKTINLERIEQLHTYENSRRHADPDISESGFGPLMKLITLAAQSEAPLLITGETGTGKNVLAQYIHDQGSLRQAPCIAINCAALPENLIEAELFGYEKGAFTGAAMSRKGIFEMAEGGTLVLDEIAEMPLNLQAKLLGVLESKQIKKIGEDAIRPVNARVMALTNRDIDLAIRQKTLREDLYYRLSVLHIAIPPLRERPHDIPALCSHILKKITSAEVEISELEMQGLMEYPWPGNIRELRNILERAVLLRDGPRLSVLDLLGEKTRPLAPPPSEDFPGKPVLTLCELEKAHIAQILSSHNGNYRQTAKLLGISLSTLKRRVKEYAIRKTGFKLNPGGSV